MNVMFFVLSGLVLSRVIYSWLVRIDLSTLRVSSRQVLWLDGRHRAVVPKAPVLRVLSGLGACLLFSLMTRSRSTARAKKTDLSVGHWTLDLHRLKDNSSQ
jgi:hypothetical protein